MGKQGFIYNPYKWSYGTLLRAITILGCKKAVVNNGREMIYQLVITMETDYFSYQTQPKRQVWVLQVLRLHISRCRNGSWNARQQPKVPNFCLFLGKNTFGVGMILLIEFTGDMYDSVEDLFMIFGRWVDSKLGSESKSLIDF